MRRRFETTAQSSGARRAGASCDCEIQNVNPSYAFIASEIGQRAKDNIIYLPSGKRIFEH
jgi:hypothetical protein